MSTQSHDALITRQFGPKAADYVASAVHAAGEDLAEMQTRIAASGARRLLDCGCGGGHVAYAAAPHVADVVAYDLSAEMLSAVAATAAQKGLTSITTRQGPAERLPFADASFDIVASRYSAHHWGDVEAGLREARRVLKPGGLAIFADAVAPGTPALDTFLQTIEMLRDPSHARDYTVPEWVLMMTRAGLAVTSVTPRRIRLDYPSWIQRMRTPKVLADAIRALQDGAAAETRRHFAIEDDGSFMLDNVVLTATVA